MKLKSKKGWNSIVPLRLKGKTAKRSTSHCGQAPVYLNVYDLTPINGYLYWAGLGIFHSGVQVHGVEYGFGAHDFPTSGVFEVEPRHCPGFRFRKSVLVGTTSLNPKQARQFMERNASGYNGDTYHVILKNCNHFCKDVCYKLTGNKIPKWVNRLAKIGSTCNCMLPETLKVTAVKQDGRVVMYGREKKRVKDNYAGMSPSVRMWHRQTLKSSLLSGKPECSKNKALRGR